MAPAYRADHVGSLLRPPELLEAREKHPQKQITAEQLGAAEDAAVLKALELQREVGISVFTEGEYRRGGWSTAIRDSVEGLVPTQGSPIAGFLGQWQGPHGELATASLATGLVGGMGAGAKLRQVRRLAGTEAAFLKAHAPGPWKITMPGAMSGAGQLFKQGVTDAVYATRRDLAYDIVQMLRQEIAALHADGVAYIQ